MSTYSIWIVSPADYPHSRCFDEVAVALKAAFRSLGIKARIVREPSRLGDNTIVLGCNLLKPNMMPTGKRLILFNLEQIAPGSPWLTTEYLALLRGRPVWDYSLQNIGELARLGIGATHCDIGYMPALTRIKPAREDIDVLFVGSLNERRMAVLQDVRNRGARLAYLFNLYGRERDAHIARSKIVLNLHFHEARVFEIVRVSYLLANRKCVVSETGLDRRYEQRFQTGIAFAPYDELADVCMRLLHKPEERGTLARLGFARMSSLSQKEFLRRALAGSR